MPTFHRAAAASSRSVFAKANFVRRAVAAPPPRGLGHSLRLCLSLRTTLCVFARKIRVRYILVANFLQSVPNVGLNELEAKNRIVVRGHVFA